MYFVLNKDINIKKITTESDRQSRRDFVKLMRKFRQEYFTGDKNYGPYDMEHVGCNNTTCFNIYKHTTIIGILEFTAGQLGNKHTLDLGTIYIVPKYRNNGLSKDIYNLMQHVCDGIDVIYNTHIEDKNFIGNEKKFMQLGFTHYIKTKHTGYVGDTYCLFRKPYFKLLMPIK